MVKLRSLTFDSRIWHICKSENSLRPCWNPREEKSSFALYLISLLSRLNNIDIKENLNFFFSVRVHIFRHLKSSESHCVRCKMSRHVSYILKWDAQTLYKKEIDICLVLNNRSTVGIEGKMYCGTNWLSHLEKMRTVIKDLAVFVHRYRHLI